MSLRLAHLELDDRALRSNLALARAAAPGARVMACIKAQAYGHGLHFAAAALADHCDAFAVACTGEAVELRRAGFTRQRLCVLNGPADREELQAALDWELEPVLHQPWHLDELGALPGPARLHAWLKIDTGMGRIGVRPDQAAEWHAELCRCPALHQPVGVMTHMARADDRRDDFTRRQWQVFDSAIAGRAVPRSAANSASILGWPSVHGEWIRPGIMLYGCSPFVDGMSAGVELQPVMTLRAPLIAINHVAAGATVGYGSRWSAPEAVPIGVIGIGYGDGYPRAVADGTPVLIRGRRAPIVGRVSMDKITVDLRGVDAAVGDPVTLWGRGLPVEEIAGHAGTIGYELLCSVYGRVPAAAASS